MAVSEAVSNVKVFSYAIVGQWAKCNEQNVSVFSYPIVEQLAKSTAPQFWFEF